MNKNEELSFMLRNNNLTIYLLEMLHNAKFPKITREAQEEKVLEEFAEFQTEINIDNKVLEAVDCIFALIGYITKSGYEVEHIVKQKLSQVLLRDYPDNFHHTESEK